MFGVPASNRCGGFLNELFSSVTLTIISPPPCQGGIASRISKRAVEHANSGRRAHFVTGERQKIATDLLHVQRHVPDALRRIDQGDRADTPRACRQSSATGLIVPSEFETCVKANSFTSGREQRSKDSPDRASHRRAPARNASWAPIRSASNCHGTRLLWCSISVSRITSPDPQKFSAPGLRDEIDAFSRAASEHDFVRAVLRQ